MIVLAAFISGAALTAVSVFVPHARGGNSSIEEFKSLQTTLAKLPAPRVKKHQNA